MENKVRLRPQAIEHIKSAFKEIFLEGDKLWIFGSRADLTARGGDIDLYIETQTEDFDTAYSMKKKFWTTLQRLLGEQKIDIIVLRKNTKPMLIHEVAQSTGVRLL